MKRALLVVGVSLILMSSAQADPTWYIYNGHKYALTEEAGTWEQSQAEAEALGANLVTVDNAAENQWLTDTFHATSVVTTPFTQFWIGLYSTDQPITGPWEWADGSPVNYTNWYPGQPDGVNGGFPVLWATLWGPGAYASGSTLGFWNDASAGHTWQGIMEMPAVPLPGAVLLVGIGTVATTWLRRKSLLS
jgi:hypothetical protein